MNKQDPHCGRGGRYRIDGDGNRVPLEPAAPLPESRDNPPAAEKPDAGKPVKSKQRSK